MGNALNPVAFIVLPSFSLISKVNPFSVPSPLPIPLKPFQEEIVLSSRIFSKLFKESADIYFFSSVLFPSESQTSEVYLIESSLITISFVSKAVPSYLER